MKKVRAAVLKGPTNIQIEEFPYSILKEGALLLKVEVCGICGTDKHLYKGEVNLWGKEFQPLILGHEIVGIVEEIKGEYRDFYGVRLRPGDRVVVCPDILCGECYHCRHSYPYSWCDNMRSYGTTMSCKMSPHLYGGFAEYMYIEPGTYLHKVPEGIPSEVASLTENLTGAASLDMIGLNLGDRIVIQGVGPIGLAYLIRAKILGAGKVIAINRSSYKLEIAKEFGADELICMEETSSEERIEKVRELTEGRGADMVIKCVGIPDIVPEGLKMLRKGGIYLDPGTFVDREVSLNLFRDVVSKGIHYIGVANLPVTEFGITLKLLEKYADVFPFEKAITHRFRLNEFQKAIEKSTQPDCMKVVITFQ